MSNYQPHNPNQTEHQRERDRWSRRQENSDNSGQGDYDLYDQQQDARYAWNPDPDYRDAANPSYRGSNVDPQWEHQQRGGDDRGRISYADHWPPNGYETQQSISANPRWQNNPSRPKDHSRRGAYGLHVDQSNDYSLGLNSSGDRSYKADRYNADRYNNSNPYYRADRNDGFAQGSSAAGAYNQGYRGRGPKGYERSDERVHEDICEQLTLDPFLDASEITVTVKAGVVTLEGSIDERMQKHRAEDIADSCSGVKDVQNRLNVASRNQRDSASSTQSSPQQTFQQPTQSLTSSVEESGPHSSKTGESKPMAQQKPTRQ